MKKPDDPAFNLLYEPWIMVKKHDGTCDEVSMLSLFKNAPQYHSLSGELPTQDIAVLRLLLAVLHRTFSGKDIEGAPFIDDDEEMIDGTLKLWQALWEKKSFPYERIETYLEKFNDRFWLFHPETPFYQVAAMEKGTGYSAAKLNGELSESANKLRLFPHRSGNGKTSLRYADAARWLLHVNGFDDTAAKPTQKGLPSPGAGWVGKLGLITAVGNNLFETLLLNLVLLPPEKGTLWGVDRAVWEEAPRTKERVSIATPNSQATLLTLQSRRLVLKREDDTVIGYLLQGGDFFAKENALVEQFTVWRNNTKNAAAPPEFSPSRHNPSVQMWRGFASLVEQNEQKLRPGIISWLNKLKDARRLDRTVFTFQICGVNYGDKDFFVDDIFSDSLSFNAALLSELGEDWVNRIIEELDLTDRLVKEAGVLAQNVSKAAGDEDGYAANNAAKEQAFHRLDMPFREWLESIAPEAENTSEKMNAKCEEWWKEAQRIVRILGSEIVKNCSPQALIGRVDSSTSKIYSAPEAYNWFVVNTANPSALKRESSAKRKKERR